MFLRHTRADKRQESFDFRLRKPKKSHVQSPNIFSHSDDTANTNFTPTSNFLAMQKNNFSMDNFLDNDLEQSAVLRLESPGIDVEELERLLRQNR